MNQKAEAIDSSRMEILSEFDGAPDEDGETIPYRLGVLGEDFIVASQSSIARKPQGKVVPENANERTKFVFENGIKRDWWSGDIVFELKNFDGVLQRLEEIFGERPARPIDLNAVDIINGKDEIAVSLNSVMPHNVGAPVVTVQISIYRALKIDINETDGWHLYLAPETGEKLMKEMQKIQPLIKAKLQTSL